MDEQLPDEINNNLFSNYYLAKRVQELDEWNCDEEAKNVFNEIKEKLAKKRNLKKDNEKELQRELIEPVFDLLGHSYAVEQPIPNENGKTPDFAFFRSDKDKQSAKDSSRVYERSKILGDAKKWEVDLDKDEDGEPVFDNKNPSFQVYYYLNKTEAQWGILTNGRKWRLFYKEENQLDVFFEIDLAKLLMEEYQEKFKYFYLFFRKESFYSRSSTPFLEQVYQGSKEYSESLEDDLEDKIYSALEISARGFFQSNNLEKTDENIDLVHRSSLILLYRMLFVLNAESRELLPVNDPQYKQAVGFTWFKQELRENPNSEHFRSGNTRAWNKRIQRLFTAIDEGQDLFEDKIPAYNGGLFESPEDGEEVDPENQFLAEHELEGNFVKEIIELLIQSENEDKEKVFIDYEDLNIRHLGSIYEGLLEHEFQQAEENLLLKSGKWVSAEESGKEFDEADPKKKVEKGQVYLTNESGERKATGSYYTPDYIVEYIVENTVGPKMEEKIEKHPSREEIEGLPREEQKEAENQKLASILSLDVCDPAMGSGHFLTEATSFIARKITEEIPLQNQDIDENDDEFTWAKRQVVQNCIYGVDINPLAVELGKLSLWIETMAEGKPLNFLDHHLKHGNSLIGSEFNEIFLYPFDEEQKTLQQIDEEKFRFGSPTEQIKKFKEDYKEIEEMDEETVDDIHEKEQKYKEFQDKLLYKHFKQVANIHTHQYFENDITQAEYESELLQSVGIPDNTLENEEWYTNAEKDAENRNYFHWQLEFPKIFFGQQNGFDAVVGNPPYVKIQNIPENQREYLEETYDVAEERYDLYGLFTEKGLSISGSEFGYILPSKFFESQAGAPLRKYLRNRKAIREIDSFEEYQVFDGVTTYTCLLFLSKDQTKSFKVRKAQEKEATDRFDFDLFESFELNYSHLQEKWDLTNPKKMEVVDRIKGFENSLEDLLESIYVGIQTSANDIFYVDKMSEDGNLIKCKTESGVRKLEKELLYPILLGKDIKRFRGPKDDRLMIYPYKKDDGETKLIEEDDLRDKYPKIYNYLSEHKEKLSDRETESQEYESWYAHWCPRNFERKEKEKLLTPDVSMRGQFTYDPEGKFFFSNSAYSLVIEDENFDYFDLMAVLNSKLSDFFLVQTAPTLRGGYHRNNTQYLFPITIPEEIDSRLSEVSEKIYEKEKKSEREKDNFLEWVESEWSVEIEDLSLYTHLQQYWEYDFDEFMRVAKKNKSQIDGSVKSRGFRELMKDEWERSMNTLRPLMKEIDNLEAAIDAIVFDLYGLTEEEVETVLDSLNTKEDEKSAIIEEFRKMP